MQLVLDIPEDYYNAIKAIPDRQCDADMLIIKYGTPLPKGHGELVDISPYKGKVICSHLYSGVKKLIEVDSIEPIIAADREGEEE